MQKLTIGVLRKYNTWYEYNLSEELLKRVYKVLTSDEGIVSESDIFEELENVIV